MRRFLSYRLKGTGNCERDSYYIYGGKNTVVDKGGENKFYFRPQGIYSGKYTTGSGEDTFEVVITGSEGEININSGDGVDTLNIYNDTKGTNNVLVNADLGKGNDIVLVDYKDGSTAKDNSSILNLKTGKGEDTVKIYAGKKNNINTGDDNDTITVHNTAVNTTSIINAGKGNDTILIEGGENTIYGGNDTITISVGGETAPTQHNTVYAYADTVNLEGGNNTVYTKKGGNEINIQRKTPNYAPSEEIYLQKGDNTVNFIGNTLDKPTEARVHITSGKNIINANGYSIVNIDTVNSNNKTVNVKTKQTITVEGNAQVNSIQLGSGADVITNSSYAIDDFNNIGTHAGAGNDKFYISNGTNKKVYGENGNDYFKITGTISAIAEGGKGNDTFDIYGGETNHISGGEGNDIFTVNSGNNAVISGDKGKDTFNIIGGNSCSIQGGDDNDTFNIYGGGMSSNPNFVFGQNGNDTYNLDMQSGVVIINDDAGKNTINVANGFKGIATIAPAETGEQKLNFDKSYTLTTSANIDDGVIATSDSNITLYRFFEYNKDTQTGDFNQGVQLVTNVKEAISDSNISNDRYIGFEPNAVTSIKVGGKDYTLNLDQLKSDLVAWFNDHNTYDSSYAVLNGGDETDINSLIAVYTKDTAGCFVK